MKRAWIAYSAAVLTTTLLCVGWVLADERSRLRGEYAEQLTEENGQEIDFYPAGLFGRRLIIVPEYADEGPNGQAACDEIIDELLIDKEKMAEIHEKGFTSIQCGARNILTEQREPRMTSETESSPTLLEILEQRIKVLEAQISPWRGLNVLSEHAIIGSKSPIREFIATQAATGCRIGELRALRVSDFDSPRGLFRVSRTLSCYGETSTKTDAGIREVDLHPDITAMLIELTANKNPQERLFNVTDGQLRWAFERMNVKSHSLRHFRYTLLQKAQVHPTIHNYWIGHSVKGMAAIYGHLHEDLDLRQRIALEVGLGFNLPAIVAPQRAEVPEAVQAIA